MSSSGKQSLFILFLGDFNVGKTSIINQFVKGEFTKQYKATICSDADFKRLNIDGRSIELKLIDIAGQDRFRSYSTILYQNIDCCILVYDITNLQSFENIKKWRNEFIEKSGLSDSDDFPFVLLGNKTDLAERKVYKSAAQNYAMINEYMLFYEVSSKTGDNIQEAFEEITKKVLEKKPKKEDLKIIPSTETVQLQDKQENKPNKFFQFFSSVFQKNKQSDTNQNIQLEFTKQNQEFEMQLANKIKKFQSQLENMNKEFESIKNDFDILLENKNKEFESIINDFKMKLENMNKEIASKDEQIKRMQNQLETMNKKHDKDFNNNDVHDSGDINENDDQ